MPFNPFAQLDDSKYLGRPFEEVVAELKETNTVVHAVPSNAMVTMDYRMERLRVRYNEASRLVTSVRRG
jgi:hypothetical protein